MCISVIISQYKKLNMQALEMSQGLKDLPSVVE